MSSSINTDPDLWTYSGAPLVCPLCYPAGKTPKDIFATVSGMQIGALWVPPDPGPPNGLFQMIPNAPCQWAIAVGPWSLLWWPFADPTRFAIMGPGGVLAFQHLKAGVCQTTFTNSLVVPAGNTWYGGHATLTPMLDSASAWIPDCMEDLNIEARDQLWANSFPIDESQSVFRFSHVNGKTNIKVKYDTT